MIVYLIHFSGRVGHAQHYLGTTRFFKQRMRHHKAGTGAAILKACNERGIQWRVVRKWFGSYELERQLKAAKNARLLCPLCRKQKLKAKARARKQRENTIKADYKIPSFSSMTAKAVQVSERANG